jgi:hypothetical protein
MSIKGHRGFDNDDAREWLLELIASPDLDVLKEAFELAEEEYEEDEYVEASEALPAIAAAEVVAALAGEPANDLPKVVKAWVANKPEPSSKLMKRARRVVEVILTHSEVREAWEESDQLPQWKAAMLDLMARLRQ